MDSEKKMRMSRSPKGTSVYDRLTKPTLAATLKSKRGEDQNTKAQWKETMEERFAREEREEEEFWMKHNKQAKTNRPVTASAVTGTTERKERKTRQEREEFKVSRSPGFSSGMKSPEKSNGTNDESEDIDARRSRAERTVKVDYHISPYMQSQKKGYTFGGKTKDKKAEEAPGPGNYQYKSKAVEGPEYSIYKKYPQKIEPTPGPGDYEDAKKQNSGFTIGQRLRKKNAEELPAPGQYEAISQLVEGPQYSIYQKRDQKIEQTPGPGDYNQPEKEQKGVTIGQRFGEKKFEDLPAPGQYSTKSHIVEGPQYSMYQKREQKLEQKPGPGDYNLPEQEQKGVTIGKRLADGKKLEDLPAPGQYEAKSALIEGPQYSIYQKRDQKIEQTPGPGDYNEPEKEQKGVTIGKRLADKKVEDLPAPGHYETKSAIVEGPQYSIYQKRDQKIEQTPGPGDYNEPTKEQKGVTIGKRLGDKKVEDLPAPGQYEARSAIVEGPQYSIYQKRDQKIEQTPGPGDYNEPTQEQKGVTIGKRLADKKAEELPAPGQYEARSALVEGPQYSIYQKRDQKIEQTPGPGDYNEPTQEQKGVTIGKRLADKKVEDLPAPGQYELKSHLNEGPQYSIYQKRDQKIEQTPGPGDYNEPTQEQKGVTIGKRLADKKVEDIPAPGQYEARSTLVEGPQYSIYQKRDQKIEQTPGPGDYNEPTQEQKGVTIGKRLADKKAEDLPAPGQYELKSHLNEGPQYSIYQKRDQKIEQTPGPGDYNEPTQEQKGVTIGQRLPEKRVEELPAPGQYLTKSHLVEGPQYSIYQKRDQKIEQTPGPGDYNEPVKEQKGVTIGKRLGDKKVEDIPAPGQYEARSTIVEGPQYSIYQKRDQKIEQTPGPGDYNEPTQEQKGVTIGKRLADKKVEDLPAPGQYELKSHLNEGPQYSIYQKRDQKIEQTPGPGDYNEPTQEQKGVTIGQRFGEKKLEDLPAPGQYASKSHLVEGPQYSIYQKREQKIEQTPGPGDYNEPAKEEKGVTIGKRLGDKKAEDLPAPGQYEARSAIVEGPQYSIYQKRDQKIEQTPGPGDYNQPTQEQKGVTIGKRLTDKKVEELPAPGQYEARSTIVEGPQYSIYQKRDQKIEQTPGPGDYNEPAKEQKGVTIGKRLTDKKVEELPAPGQYEARSAIQEGPQYSIYQKRDQKIEQTPGPGDYNQPTQEQKGVTIGKRLTEKKAEDLPAPGQYSTKSHLVEGPQYSIYQKRDQKIEQTPGPGDYNEPSQEQKGVTIGKKLADKKIEELPAPGQYELKSHLNEGPQYSMYEKRDQKIEQTPGPGDYNDPTKEQKGVTIGKRLADKKVEDIPAPGQYEAKSTLVEGPQYSIYQKRDQKIEQTPGPGDYNGPNLEQKGVTIGQKFKEKKTEDLPGPGQYQGKSAIQEGPQYSMYQKRDQKIEQTPGPGDYNEPTKDQKGVTIGKRYAEKKQEDLPGPGEYDGSVKALTDKGFKIGTKIDTKIEAKPGPGEYEANPLITKPRPQTAAVFSKSKAKRSIEVEHEDEPGPGQYRYYKPMLAGKGVSFTKDKRDKFNTTYQPGPGSYGGISDWAPGYGYEMSIPSRMFGKSRDDGQLLKAQRSPASTKNKGKSIQNIQTARNKKKNQV